jgi:uncharacterized protein
LYGSRARGDARPDRDYDVAVFLRDMRDRVAELYRLADLCTAILEDGGEFIHAMAYPAGFDNDERMPLMYVIRAEGIDLQRRRPAPISTKRASSWARPTLCWALTTIFEPGSAARDTG